MNLYEINQLIENFEFEIDEETGEILNIMDLDQLELAKNEKIENIALWIKNLNAEADALKQEEQSLANRRKAKEKKVENLSKYLQNALNGSKFETRRVAVGFRKSTKVEVDEDFIEYAKSHKLYDLYNEHITLKPSLKAIKEQLKNGVAIEHCQLVENTNITIK